MSRTRGIVAGVAALLLAAGCGRVDTQTNAVPTTVVAGTGATAGANGAAAAPGPSAAPGLECQAITGMRLSQFVIQSMTPETPEEDRKNAHYYIDNTMGALIAAIPELKAAAERLLAHFHALIDGKDEPEAQPGQPATFQEADKAIGDYERSKCGVPAPPPAGDAASPSTTAGAAPAKAADVLPWQRSYVDPAPWPNDTQIQMMEVGCLGQLERGLRENESTGPRIAVIGDSAANLIVPAALSDQLYHWAFATHCGETFATAVGAGRVEDAIATNPDALVFALGANNTTRDWLVRPDLMDAAFVDLDRLLAATDNVKCRVILDLPELEHPDLGEAGGGPDSPEQAKTRVDLIHRINTALHNAASRPGVHIADYWKKVSEEPRKYVWDEVHPTRAGVNLMINTIIETAQPCFAPPAPTDVKTTADGDSVGVSWTAATKVSDPSFVVERSDGRAETTRDTRASFPAGDSSEPLRFRVRMKNAAAVSDWSSWVDEPTRGSSALLKVVVVLLYAVAAVAVLLLLTRRRPKTDRDRRPTPPSPPPPPPSEPDGEPPLFA